MTAEQLGDRLPQGVEGFHFHTLFEADSFALERVLAVFVEKFGKFSASAKMGEHGRGSSYHKKGL